MWVPVNCSTIFSTARYLGWKKKRKKQPPAPHPDTFLVQLQVCLMILWLAPKLLQDEETQTPVPNSPLRNIASEPPSPPDSLFTSSPPKLSSTGQGSYIHPPIMGNSIHSHFPTRWIMGLAAKVVNMSFIPGAHLVREENQLP